MFFVKRIHNFVFGFCCLVLAVILGLPLAGQMFGWNGLGHFGQQYHTFVLWNFLSVNLTPYFILVAAFSLAGCITVIEMWQSVISSRKGRRKAA